MVEKRIGNQSLDSDEVFTPSGDELQAIQSSQHISPEGWYRLSDDMEPNIIISISDEMYDEYFSSLFDSEDEITLQDVGLMWNFVLITENTNSEWFLGFVEQQTNKVISWWPHETAQDLIESILETEEWSLGIAFPDTPERAQVCETCKDKDQPHTVLRLEFELDKESFEVLEVYQEMLGEDIEPYVYRSGKLKDSFLEQFH